MDDETGIGEKQVINNLSRSASFSLLFFFGPQQVWPLILIPWPDLEHETGSEAQVNRSQDAHMVNAPGAQGPGLLIRKKKKK